MYSNLRAPYFRLAGVIFLMSGVASLGYAQNRLNDKDLESLMRNLRDDAKSFRPKFNSAIQKSPIRKTSREKDAKALVSRFEKQTETMLNNFKRTKKGDADLPGVLSSAQQIDRYVYDLNAPQTALSWQKIQSELQQVSSAFGVAEQYPNPRGITAYGSPASNGPSCSQAVGAGRAQKLVEECLAVSPATHPPCNAQNSCVLITDEIKRGCAMLRQGAPAFCSEYQ
jgi:hypothetical protein